MQAALAEHFAEANVNYFMGTPLPPAEGDLGDLIARMDGRSAYYLQTITGIPDSLYAEGMIG